MRAIVVDTGDEARHQVFTLLPAGAQVMTMTSRTLETIGVAEEIHEPSEPAESRRYDAVRPKLLQMDMQAQWPEMRRMGASPEFTIGSVHAVSEHGEVFVASMSGNQLAAYVYGASAVIWVVGSQKIVPDRDAAWDAGAVPDDLQAAMRACAIAFQERNWTRVVRGDTGGTK